MKIWRLGHIREDWNIFRNNNILSFDWLYSKIDYSKVTDFKDVHGWTCIKPWVTEVKKNDLIFIVSKNEYAGVAIVQDSYKFNKYDFRASDHPLPGIPVKFIHNLPKPIIHNIKIEALRPKTFYTINGIGFNLFKVMEFLRINYPLVLRQVHDYLLENGNAESDKISRVCWNEHDWKKPSGPSGKNQNGEAFESLYGFGFEEWLNVKSRVIEGFHYSFLQPLMLDSDIHVDKIYNISLIKNDINGNRYFVGLINNAICISKEESEYIYKIYNGNGWLKQMAKEVKSNGGDYKKFISQPADRLFNIKFKPKDILIFDESLLIKDDPIKTYRYKLLDGKIDFDISILEEEPDDEGNFRSTSKIKRTINTEIIYDAVHGDIQNELVKVLRKQKDIYKKVFIEKDRVDIKAKTVNDEWHFFEIKTYGSSKKSIRSALGQIMEYAYWPDSKRAEKLFIISENDPDGFTKRYMNFLRTKFNVPVYYRSFKLPNILGQIV